MAWSVAIGNIHCTTHIELVSLYDLGWRVVSVVMCLVVLIPLKTLRWKYYTSKSPSASVGTSITMIGTFNVTYNYKHQGQSCAFIYYVLYYTSIQCCNLIG